jgi:hypothetical protein
MTLFCELYAWKDTRTRRINEFMQHRLRDGISQRGAIMMHTKVPSPCSLLPGEQLHRAAQTMIGIFEPLPGKADDLSRKGKRTRGFAYVGSHNL